MPLTEFCEWTPDTHRAGSARATKGRIWFGVVDQPTFIMAGFWQETKEGRGFTMVTCDPNEFVAPIHPEAMITILHLEDHRRWLECALDDVVGFQRPYPADQMTVGGPMFPKEVELAHENIPSAARTRCESLRFRLDAHLPVVALYQLLLMKCQERPQESVERASR